MALVVPPESTGIVVQASQEPKAPENGSSPSFTESSFLLEGHKGAITSLNFLAPETNLLLSTSSDRTALLWDLSDESLPAVLCLKGTKKPFTAAVVLSERCEAVLADPYGTLYVYDLSDGTRISRCQNGRNVPVHQLVTFGEHLVACACGDGGVRIWDMREPAKHGPAQTLVLDDKSAVLALTVPIRTHQLGTGSLSGAVRVLDVRSGTDSTAEILHTHRGLVSGVCAGEGGGGIAALAEDGISILDSRPFRPNDNNSSEGRERVRIADAARANFEVSLPRIDWKEAAVVSSSSDGILRCWAVEGTDADLVAVHERRAAPLTSIAIHPTLSAVASGAEDGTIHLSPIGVDIDLL